MKLSIRHNAAIEASKSGVGITTTVRLYFRKNISWSQGLNNQMLNDTVAFDFQKAKPIYRFKLKSGEIAELRQSGSNMYYVAKILSGGQYVIIAVQTAWKQPKKEETISRRMQENWKGDK